MLAYPMKRSDAAPFHRKLNQSQVQTDRRPAERLCYVLDDESGIFPVVGFALTRAGYSCSFFEEYTEFAVQFDRMKPDLVVCDLALGNNDAVEVIRFLQENGYRGLVLLISGLDEGALRRVQAAGKRHGLNLLPFLRKPFRASDLRRVLDDHDACAPTSLSLGEVDTALAEGFFRPFYQPKVDLKTGRIVGAEALARLNHPDKGLLKPSAFIGDLDARRLVMLSETMMTAVMNDLPRLETPRQRIPISLNIPPEIFHQIDLSGKLRDHIARHGRRPMLIIELTENAICEDLDLICDLATQCRIYGVELSIDDFGAGLSNLSRLRKLPFDEIKIDASLACNCHSDMTDRILVKAIIDLARTFGARTVAEGVEVADAARVLGELGCDLAQGYYFGRPASLDHFIEMLGAA